MKNYRLLFSSFLIFINLCLCQGVNGQNTPPAPYAGTAVNYVRTWETSGPGQTPASLATAPLTAVKQTTSYYDGFGRPMQTVLKQGSPMANDMVTAHTYNPYGQEATMYLPFASVGAQSGDVTNDGTFKTDAFQQQVAFYNGILAGQPNETNTGPGGSNWAYGQNVFEESPMNRVLSAFSPGANWVGTQLSSAASHSIQQEALLNTATDVVRIWNIAAAQGSIPTSSGTYPANTLHKAIRIDEQGHQVISYTDLYGQEVLRKVQAGTTSDNGSGSAHAGWLCTYNVYDDYGNLRFVIPAAVVQLIDGSWNIPQTMADELCYRFEYDQLNRMVIKKTPGTPSGSAGEVWMVYDVRNRLVMKQDGDMRASSKGSQWLCSLYDGLDRLVMTGMITSSNTLSQMQTAVTGQTGGNTTGTVSGAAAPSIQGVLDLTAATMTGDWQASQAVDLDAGFSTQDGGVFIAEVVPQTATAPVNTTVVNNNPLPAGVSVSPLTAFFYDNYNWLSTSGTNLSSTLDQTYTSNVAYFYTSIFSPIIYAAPITQSRQIQGIQTGELAVGLDAAQENLYAAAIYDDHARVIQAQNINISGGKDIATKQYDWTGKLLREVVAHAKNGTNQQTHLVATAWTYDAVGRLEYIDKTVVSNVNGATVAVPESPTVTRFYDELGRLQKKVYGASLETQQYEYNPRGWLLGMNRTFAKTAGPGSNYFGYELGYDKGTITSGSTTIGSYANPVFDGRVAGALWKSKGDNQIRKYDYGYDVPGRLTGADFNQLDGSVFDKTAGIDFSVSGINYDGNGNLGAMNQNGWLLGGSQQIDALQYMYLTGNGNSNRLQNVMDNSPYNNAHPASTLGDLHYAGTKAATAVDYGYDNNGNVISDANRSVASIAYNYLNLPQLITIAGGKGTIQFIYDASGNKLKKITTETNGSVTYNGTAYQTSIITTTTYISDFVYQSVVYGNAALASLQYTDKLQYIKQEEGRIRALYNNTATPATPTAYAFDYFIRDNVNNVRMVLTDESWQDTYPAATMESNTIATEQSYYSIINDAAHVIPVSSLPWWTGLAGYNYQDNNSGVSNPGNPNPTATSAQVYKLNGQTGDRFGLGITLKVMTGDNVSILGRSVWHSTGTSASSFPLSAVLSSFLGAFAGTTPVVETTHSAVTGATLGNAAATTGSLNGLLNNTPGQPNAQAPKAAINWILFNDQFVPVSMGTDLVSSTGDVIKPHSDLNIPMTANGYLYVYCSNESNIDVYFDNLQVVQTRGPVLEETHYYPLGLEMAGISDHAWGKLVSYDRYQGKEKQTQEFSDGTGLEEDDFGARFYDHQIGRWHTQDPAGQFASPYLAMGDNWTKGIDRDGQLWGLGEEDLIVGVLGFITGYVSYGVEQGNWGGKALLSGVIDAGEAEMGYKLLGGGAQSTKDAVDAANADLPDNEQLVGQALTNAEDAAIKVTGGLGTMKAALSYSANFALGAIASITSSSQVHKSDGWSALGLIAGYSFFAALSAGTSSDYFKNGFGAKLDKYIYGNDDPELLGAFPVKGGTAAGLGGMVAKAGTMFLNFYDPTTDKWNISSSTVFWNKILYEGFGDPLLSTAVTESMDEYSDWDWDRLTNSKLLNMGTAKIPDIAGGLTKMALDAWLWPAFIQ